MKWSWKFVRIAGIDIYIHVTFFLLIYLVGISYWNQEGSLNAVIAGVCFILARQVASIPAELSQVFSHV